MKYIKLFETAAAFETAKATLYLPNVSLVKELMNTTGGLTYTPYVAPPAPHNYANDYFTFAAIDNCSFMVNSFDGALYYSLDNGETWTEYDREDYENINVTAGNKVLFKSQDFDVSYNGSCALLPIFSTTDYMNENASRFNVEGNVMSLLYGDNFANQTEFPNDVPDYVFSCLLKSNKGLINAENLILPATTLADSCYYEMFYGCNNLLTAPELPATTLADYCYHSMFGECSSLTTAPVLSATTLVSDCYSYMFERCSSLNSITCLATDISASGCVNYWLDEVAQTGTFTKAASMSDWETGDDGIPDGWTIQDYTE